MLKITVLCSLLENEGLCEFFEKANNLTSNITLKSDYILSAIPNGFLEALLSKGYLRFYFKRKKLITKCQNWNYGH